jgi:hypothetical protein
MKYHYKKETFSSKKRNKLQKAQENTKKNNFLNKVKRKSTKKGGKGKWGTRHSRNSI